MFCNLAIEFIKKSGISEKILLDLVIEHIVDELRLPEIIILLNQMTKPAVQPNAVQPTDTNEVFDGGAQPTMSRELTNSINTYLTRQILTGKNSIKGFLWKDGGKLVILVKQKNDNVWRLAESEDIKDLEEKMNERKTDFLSNLNKVIGFMNDFKSENYAVFKIKYIDSPRVLGARCDQNSNKSKAIEILNSIMGSNIYSPQLDIPQREICIIQEFYLRIFENERKNKKHWFLSPPNAVLTNIEKFTTIVKLK